MQLYDIGLRNGQWALNKIVECVVPSISFGDHFCPGDIPTVSFSVFVGTSYPAHYLLGLLLCLERQTLKDFEVVIQTDGVRPDIEGMIETHPFESMPIRLYQRGEVKRHWGFPYIQDGVNLCNGKYIVCTYDDNYYVPIFLHQMVTAMDQGYDLVMCHTLGVKPVQEGRTDNYYGRPLPILGEGGMGGFMATKALLDKVPFPESREFDADSVWVEALGRAAAKVAIVPKALFVWC